MKTVWLVLEDRQIHEDDDDEVEYSVKPFRFETQAEAEAFRRGVQTACGLYSYEFFGTEAEAREFVKERQEEEERQEDEDEDEPAQGGKEDEL
jgi:hypothetical protein